MAGREWVVMKPDEGLTRALEALGCPALLSRLLVNRGIGDAAGVRAFLEGGQELFDPFLLRGMEAAVSRVNRAIERGEKIVVYGDYDVDGVTATALLLTYLKSRGATAEYYIPRREGEGYGLNADAARKICNAGAGLIVTVDTGISAFEEARLIRSLGVGLIITDHHEPRAELPEAEAIVNPRQPGCGYPFKRLAGVGVAFKLVCALEGGSGQALEKFGALVALGTVADVVPLVNENRELVRRGLALMRGKANLWAEALFETAGAGGREVTAPLLGFTAAPRINAAGRMGSAGDALGLLTAGDEAQARELAFKLDASNRLRQGIEGEILAEAVGKIGPAGPEEPVLVVSGEGWHNGVIGIVASRLAELYAKPAVLVSFEGEIGRASCRSFPGYNIHDALEHSAGLLERFGGHELAAGFTVKRENYGALCEALQRYARALPEMPVPELRLECALEPGEITLDAARECKKLEPCGAGNPEPLFFIREARVISVTPLKEGRHLRIEFRCAEKAFKGMFFNAAGAGVKIAPGDIVDLAAGLDVNRYNGGEYLSVIVRELRVSCVFDEGRSLYQKLLERQVVNSAVLPRREDFAAVYRMLRSSKSGRAQLRRALPMLQDEREGFSYAKLLIVLDVFSEMKLITFSASDDEITFEMDNNIRVDLDNSGLMRRLSGV